MPTLLKDARSNLKTPRIILKFRSALDDLTFQQPHVIVALSPLSIMLSHAIAGPSRAVGAARSIHTTAFKLAAANSGSSPKPARSYQRPTAPNPDTARRIVRPVKPVIVEPVVKSPPTSSASNDKTGAAPIKADEWAWDRLPEREPGWVHEERMIFTRPQDIFAGEPGRIKFAWVFAATIIVSVIAVPTVDDLDRANNIA